MLVLRVAFICDLSSSSQIWALPARKIISQRVSKEITGHDFFCPQFWTLLHRPAAWGVCGFIAAEIRNQENLCVQQICCSFPWHCVLKLQFLQKSLQGSQNPRRQAGPPFSKILLSYVRASLLRLCFQLTRLHPKVGMHKRNFLK